MIKDVILEDVVEAVVDFIRIVVNYYLNFF